METGDCGKEQRLCGHNAVAAVFKERSTLCASFYPGLTDWVIFPVILRSSGASERGSPEFEMSPANCPVIPGLVSGRAVGRAEKRGFFTPTLAIFKGRFWSILRPPK